MRKFQDDIGCTIQEWEAWGSLRFHKELFHQMMIETHNAAIDCQDREAKRVLFKNAERLAILCDRAEGNFRGPIDW